MENKIPSLLPRFRYGSINPRAPQADAVFIPGAAAMSLHAIPAVEAEFGKPAFTNLSVEVWHNLVRPGVIAPVRGWGRLLANG